jgi:hypothetical protein
MRHLSIVDSSDGYRRPGAARRTPADSARVPSQDVSRYQARNMPPPTYELERKQDSGSWPTILVFTLAVVTIGAGIALIERIATALSP